MPSPRILAVDDEKKILDILSYFLKESGFDVDAFTDPKEALKAAGENRYDLAVLDIVLQGDDGFSVARKLRGLPEADLIPILFASARLEMNELFLKNFEGKVGFLPKPFKKQVLVKKVRDIMQND